MKAIQIQRFGGPEVLEPVEIAEPEPTDSELVLDITASGINYADTHKAENSYLAETKLPYVPGIEAVGTLADGRRVAALMVTGGYAQKAIVAPGATFPADGLSDGQALALVLQGNTAYHLLHSAARVQPGDSVVVHAAAGGVGTLAVQLAKQAGARVIGVASTPEKRDLVTRLGADATVEPVVDRLADALREANDGSRVDIVLEMVGGETFAQSLKALGRFGRLVSYGTASRVHPPAVEPVQLMAGSKSIIGFWLDDMLHRPQALTAGWKALTEAVADGSLEPVIGGSYPLSDARRAHEELRARQTVGKLVLDCA